MKIAISGKGGVGKTTIAGTLCRTLGRSGREVLAIDGDPNPNLAIVLGIEGNPAPPPLSGKLLERYEGEDGKTRVRLEDSVEEVFRTHGIVAPDNVTLLLLGKPEHAGTGCMCSSHAVVREVVHAAVAQTDRITVLDMEASLEHMKRGTAKYVDALYVVVEPYYRSLEAAARIQELARELEIEQVAVIANKVRSDEDREAIEQFCAKRGLDLRALIPFDETLAEAEREGRSIVELNGASVAVQRIAELGKEILASAA